MGMCILQLAITGGVFWVFIGIAYSIFSRRKIDAEILIITSNFVGMFLHLGCFLYMQCTGNPLVTMKPLPADLPGRTLWLCLGSCALCGFTNYLHYKFMSKAMMRGPNGIIWNIVQCGMVFPFLMGILFFSDPATAPRVGGILLILFSLALFGRTKNNAPGAMPAVKGQLGWFPLAILGFLCVGVNQCANLLVSYVPRGAEVPAVLRVLSITAGLLVSSMFMLAFNYKRLLPYLTKANLKLAVLLTLAMTALEPTRYFLMYPAFDHMRTLGAGAVAYPLCVCSCIIGFFLYSLIFIKEKLRPAGALGFAAAVCGVLLLCVPARSADAQKTPPAASTAASTEK